MEDEFTASGVPMTRRGAGMTEYVATLGIDHVSFSLDAATPADRLATMAELRRLAP